MKKKLEMNYMFLWKSKSPLDGDLKDKVEKMLFQLFPDSQIDKIILKNENGTICEVPFKCSNDNNEIVYLKLEASYSKFNSIKLLDKINRTICDGKHRENFSIVCTYDDVSMYCCCRLMEPLGTFERRLRELVYLIIIKAFGINWIKKTFPKEFIAKLKEKGHGIPDAKLTESALELLDYNEITDYLFSERHLEGSPEQIAELKLSKEQIEELPKEKLVEIITKVRKGSLWDKLFSQYNHLNFLNAEKLDSLRLNRNNVMHHHTINLEKFKTIKAKINKVNNCLIDAIDKIESKIYTSEDYIEIFKYVPSIVTGIIGKLNISTTNIQNYTSSIINNTRIELLSQLSAKASALAESFELATKTLYFSNCLEAYQTNIGILSDKMSELTFAAEKSQLMESYMEMARTIESSNIPDMVSETAKNAASSYPLGKLSEVTQIAQNAMSSYPLGKLSEVTQIAQNAMSSYPLGKLSEVTQMAQNTMSSYVPDKVSEMAKNDMISHVPDGLNELSNSMSALEIHDTNNEIKKYFDSIEPPQPPHFEI